MAVPRLEVERLGCLHVVHNTRSGTLVLSNDPDLPLVGPEDPLNEEQRSVLATWAASGLFEDHRFRPTDVVQRCEDAEDVILGFEGPGGRVSISMPEGPLANQLRCLLAHCLVGGDGEAVLRYDIAHSEGAYTAWCGETPLTEKLDLDTARFFVARLVCEGVHPPGEVAASFHASCVERNGKALILVGASGRGKTTTALGLQLAGCRQVADDHLPLSIDGKHVFAFPSAIGLKTGTVALPEGQALLEHGEAPQVRDGVRYVYAPSSVPSHTPLPVAAIVFPEFSADAKFEMTEVSPEEGLLEVIEAGARLCPNVAGAASLARLLNETPLRAMRYSRSADSIPACLALLDAPETS